MNKITVLIADDHALVREGIAAFLRMHDDIEVIAEACDGLEAIDKCKKHRPDVVLMDISMPSLGGLEATVEIKKTQPEIKILVLTQYSDKEYIARFLKAGVTGYLLKKSGGNELVTAIRAASRGEGYLSSSIASEVISGYLNTGGKAIEDPYEKLSDRENQVLKLLAEGHTHKEAASLLGISVKTVIAHQSNIFEKLSLHNRSELMKFAIHKGIIKIEVDE